MLSPTEHKNKIQLEESPVCHFVSQLSFHVDLTEKLDIYSVYTEKIVVIPPCVSLFLAVNNKIWQWITMMPYTE